MLIGALLLFAPPIEAEGWHGSGSFGIGIAHDYLGLKGEVGRDHFAAFGSIGAINIRSSGIEEHQEYWLNPYCSLDQPFFPDIGAAIGFGF